MLNGFESKKYRLPFSKHIVGENQDDSQSSVSCSQNFLAHGKYYVCYLYNRFSAEPYFQNILKDERYKKHLIYKMFARF